MNIWEEDGLWWRICPKCNNKTSNKLKGNSKRSDLQGKMCKSCARLPENNANYGKVGELNPFYGRKHSAETIEFLKSRDTSHLKTEEFRAKMRDVYQKYHADRPRKSNYEYWVDKYGVVEAERRMDEFKRKSSIANSGSNNSMYGKPSPAGSGYGWKGWLDGVFFRSLRELRFMVDNPNAEGAEGNKWRAKFNYYGSERTTVPDFFLEDCKIVVECKPERLHDTELIVAKSNALREHCHSLGYEYQLIDPGIVNIDELKTLVDSGRVILHERYLERYNLWLNKK